MPKYYPNANVYDNDAFQKTSVTSSESFSTPSKQHPSNEGSIPETITSAHMQINRQAFTLNEYYTYAEYNNPQPTIKSTVKNYFKSKLSCNCKCVTDKILSFLPFIAIMRQYQLSFFFNDVIAGLTVGVMNIPQGMAYGMLTNLPPIYGLYTSFFPVIFYFFFGTSKHLSMGTFALVSLMVGEIVNKAGCDDPNHNGATNITNITTLTPATTNDQILRCQLDYVTSVTFLAGLFQIIFAVVRLDILTNYLSGPITRALTTGAAFHIFTSQLRHVFGFALGKHSGFLMLIKKYITFFSSITKTNIASLVTALICLVLIYFNKKVVNPKVKKYIKMAFPIELLLLIVLTGLSYGFNFSSPQVFNITVVGSIPRGFPPPRLPNLSLLRIVATDALVIAVVAFVISYSLAKLYADMQKYKIDSNQELYAYGLSSLLSSFFSCFMPAASLSRSNVQYFSGCKTQLAGLVSCLLLLVVILALGPLFYNLPNCVLAAIIIVNLENTFLQVTELNYLFRVSLSDAFAWVVTCLMVFLSNVDIGLGVGLVCSIIPIILKNQRPKVSVLGNVEGTELYDDVNHFAKCKEVGKVKVIKMEGYMYYANKSHFSDKTEFASVLSREDLQKVETFRQSSRVHVETEGEETSDMQLSISDLIIDCSMMPFVDADGIEAINKTIIDYKSIGVAVHLAGCSESLSIRLRKACLLGKLKEVEMFPTVHDCATFLDSKSVTKL